MSEMFQAALAQLRAIDPVLPAALLITFVFLTIYTVRKFFPRAWLWVESTVPFVDSIDPGPGLDALWKAWQAWPAMALGAATSALFAGVSVRHALWGAFCGLISALSHTIAAAYKGKVGELKPKDPSPPAASLVGVLCFIALCFVLGGCKLSKPPCDQARMAVIVAQCTAESQSCKNEGKSEAECSTLADCDSRIEKACGQ